MIGILSLAIFLYAISFNLSKFGLLYAQPIFFIGLRFLVSGFIFLITVFLQQKSIFIAKKDLWLFVQVSLFSFFLSGLMFMWSVQYLSSGKSAFIFSLMPFMFAIFSYFYLHESMSKRKWLAIAIGFAGSIPMLMGTNQEMGASEWVSLWPTVINVLSVLCYCIGIVVVRKLVKYRGYQPNLIMGMGLFTSGIALLILSFFTEGLFPVDFYSPFLFIFVLLVLSYDILYNFLYATLLKIYTATFLSLILLVSPLISSIIGWLLLSEKISWTFIPMLVFSIIGLMIFYQEEQRDHCSNT
ncbi:MAG TPA: DMT family transporter [Candidatus Babeliales bacterium]|nr:DMT family transporter [Candidatus Babeliales bacterium]